MLSLGLDSSDSSICEVAIIKDEEVLAKYKNKGSDFSSLILRTIDKTLKIARIKLKDIDILGVTEGPGRFTGLRIGIALIKSISFSLNIPWVGISTLSALSYSVFHRDKKYICPVLDAQSGYLFSCLYEKRQESPFGYKKIIQDKIIKLSELEEILKNKKKEATILVVKQAYLKEVLDNNKYCEDIVLEEGVAIYVAQLSKTSLLTKNFYLEPTTKSCNYIKLSDAEAKFLSRSTSV